MAHIHTGPGQHDTTSSGYIILTGQGEPKIYLHWHKKISRWMQFGGHIELHENLWQALAHEVREESGYDLSQLRLLQPPIPAIKSEASDVIFHPRPLAIVTTPFPGIDHYHTDISYLFVTTQAPGQAVGDGESSRLGLFTQQQIRSMPESEMIENIRDIILYIFEECLPNWEQTPATNWR
jgi:8-oxo-dGTP pyrophosphatase MutT (NUDIX family)